MSRSEAPDEAEILRRLAANRPGWRRSPIGSRWGPAEGPGGADPGGPEAGGPGASGPGASGPGAGGTGPERPRGDHDLNPDLYPTRSLTSAAVLVPIVRRPRLSLLLTRRSDHLHDHAGQIAFPGGRVDAGDADARDAALRETEEEVGLPRRHVEIVGQLDTYVTRTGFEVTPVVGLVTPPFPVEPDSFEVAEVFEVPLGFVLDPASRQIESRLYEGRERHFYVFPYRDYYIWGATAGMLVNLCEVLVGEPPEAP